ncbi:cell wall-binding repeat-containing protein [Guptibacillus algicola]|uniref:cell wall-binding repeat-containing protein n=1 Tax=Guptibacillus algicola TaxID=225844 RepID=UPI001CD194F2|nr:cell wall-binding repeat-containing protein [Alkalihalobacillus algicola]MCA0987096.1 cell wall-binding repeat-containing protein [Alkalihalobacillus algicola]
MKKVLSVMSSVIVAASLLASPSASAASNHPDLVSVKKLLNEKKLDETVELQGYNEFGDYEEEEPNNSFDQANPIELDNYVIGTFADQDKDFYKIEITGDEEVDFIISLFSTEEEGTEMELNVNLYNEDKQELEGDFDVSDEYGYLSGITLDPGVYYLEASDIANLTTGEEYLLNAFIYDPEPYIQRINGKDRYHTAAKIAIRSHGSYSSENVVLATGSDFPDALAAAPLAFSMDAPILLTGKNSLPEYTQTAMDLLDTSHVTIVGGTGVISKEVERYLEEELGFEVDRISGKDRYETAAKIANELPFATGTAVVADGTNFPDALSMAPVAAQNMMPILLTQKDSIPSATRTALKNYDSSIVVGGTGVISNAVFEKLPNAERISGKDRYGTSVAIAEEFDLDREFVNLATGRSFADALSGSVYAASMNEPMLLTPKEALDPKVKQFFVDNDTFYFRVLGGTGAVGEGVEEDIWSMFE